MQAKSKITEQLIKQITNSNDLRQIITLNLRSFKIQVNNHNIKQRIEGLSNLVNLQELNLSHNLLQKVEGLQGLINLQDLNLSDNSIKDLRGIEVLPNLKKLNLNGNLVQELIISNQGLEVLKISRNQIKDAIQLLNLRVLVSLQQVSLSDNPFIRNWTYSEYLIFLNPNLQVVDNKVISKEQIEISQMLFGNPLPGTLQQLEQNIRQIQEHKAEIDKDISSVESKIHRATNLLKTYYETSDSDEDIDNDKMIAQNTLQNLNQQLEQLKYKKVESEELLQQLQVELSEYRTIPQNQTFCPTSSLNRINSLFVRLQAVLNIDLSEQQKQLFEASLQNNLDLILQSVYDLIQITLDRIPNLPTENLLIEAADQINLQIQDLYQKVTLKKPEKQISIQKSIVLLKKLYKRAEKKFKKIEEFNQTRQQFLADFESETQLLSNRWKEYEYKKQQLKDEKETIAKEIEEQINNIMLQKEDLKNQHTQMEHFFNKSNQDFEKYRLTQGRIKQEMENELQQLIIERKDITEDVMLLKGQQDQLRERNAEIEESIRLLNEETEMIQQKIQEQYQLSFEIREEQAQGIANNDKLAQQKSDLLKSLESLSSQIQEKEYNIQATRQKMQQEQQRLGQITDELESYHQKLKNTEQLCKDADKILRQLNMAIQDKEDDLSKYDKILGESKEEKEKLKSVRLEVQQQKKESQRLKSELENIQFQYQQNIDNLNQAKKNLTQITQLTIEKEQELLQSEKALIIIERAIQESSKNKEQLIHEQESLMKEVKKLQLDKAKYQQILDDAQINVSSLKQEYQIQQQNLQTLNKQLELKVTELSTATHYHKQELEQNQDQYQNITHSLLRLQEQYDQKGYEFKQLVDQIDNLMQKRDILVKEVYGMQQQVLKEDDYLEKREKKPSQFNKPYILYDEESLQQGELNSMYDKFRNELSQLSKNQENKHLNTKSQSIGSSQKAIISDYPRVYKPRSANNSMIRKTPNKDQSVQSVIQNLDELNQNLDRMYNESLQY